MIDLRFILVYDGGRAREYSKQNFISLDRARDYALAIGRMHQAKAVYARSNDWKRVIFRVIIDE